MGNIFRARDGAGSASPASMETHIESAYADPRCQFALVRVTCGFPVLTTIGVYSRRADADLDREWFAANSYGSTYFVLERQ